MDIKEKIKNEFKNADYSILVFDKTGNKHTSNERGIKPLYLFSIDNDVDLMDAVIADKVIGKGAALLLVLNKISYIYAQTISSSALDLLKNHGIEAEYDNLVTNIQNRNKDDLCPVEKMTLNEENPEKALELIKSFLIKINQI